MFEDTHQAMVELGARVLDVTFLFKHTYHFRWAWLEHTLVHMHRVVCCQLLFAVRQSCGHLGQLSEMVDTQAAVQLSLVVAVHTVLLQHLQKCAQPYLLKSSCSAMHAMLQHKASRLAPPLQLQLLLRNTPQLRALPATFISRPAPLHSPLPSPRPIEARTHAHTQAHMRMRTTLLPNCRLLLPPAGTRMM